MCCLDRNERKTSKRKADAKFSAKILPSSVKLSPAKYKVASTFFPANAYLHFSTKTLSLTCQASISALTYNRVNMVNSFKNTWGSWIGTSRGWRGRLHGTVDRSSKHSSGRAPVVGQWRGGNRGTGTSARGSSWGINSLFFLPPGKTHRKPFLSITYKGLCHLIRRLTIRTGSRAVLTCCKTRPGPPLSPC